MTTAVSTDSCSKCDGKTRPKLLKPSELPIYDQYCMRKTSELEKDANFLEEHVRSARLKVTDVWSSLSGSTHRVVHFFATGKAHTIGAVYYLREDSNILPRIGAIALGGLTGLLFGIRGKLFKRLIYSSIGAGAVASVCYPTEAKQFSKSSYTIAKYYAIVGYNRVQDEVSSRKGEKVHVKPKVETNSQKPTIEKIGDQPSEKTSSPSTPASPPQKTNPASAVDKVEKDYGQSNPEDRDMYSTRSS